MKKLPLVAALCAASLCTVASAQSSVTVYGKLYPYLISEKGSSPTAPGTAVSTLSGSLSATPGVLAIKGMQSGNSRFGFRGTEDLGGGLKVFFQMEAVVAVDNGIGGAGPGGVFWNRDTFVGMKGGFGEVRLGGRVQMLGIPARPMEVNFATEIIFKGITVYGVIGRRMYDTWIQMSQFLRSGKFDPTPVITHRFPLEGFDEAIHAIKSGDAGKVVFEVS